MIDIKVIIAVCTAYMAATVDPIKAIPNVKSSDGTVFEVIVQSEFKDWRNSYIDL